MRSFYTKEALEKAKELQKYEKNGWPSQSFASAGVSPDRVLIAGNIEGNGSPSHYHRGGGQDVYADTVFLKVLS